MVDGHGLADSCGEVSVRTEARQTVQQSILLDRQLCVFPYNVWCTFILQRTETNV